MTAYRLGHSINRVGLPTDLLGSAAFNSHPCAMHIAGARETNTRLFQMLDESDGLDDSGEAFHKYMVAVFGLEPEQREAVAKPGQGWNRPFRSSFISLFSGWGYDSNGPEGAVLKGWVESRFGLYPTFHKDLIASFSEPAWEAYLEQKATTPYHGNAIDQQLDVVYEYCQWALANHVAPGLTHLTLYRGVNAFEGHEIVQWLDRRHAIVRLNNLISFSSDRNVADCFGETILTVEVPLSKILFFNALLPFFPLKGEGEYLVIGGEYQVVAEMV